VKGHSAPAPAAGTAPVRGRRDLTDLHGVPYYLVTELEWDSMDELRAAFASPEGQATAADAARLQELAPVHRMIFTVDDCVM
jgi:hypothetical protein